MSIPIASKSCVRSKWTKLCTLCSFAAWFVYYVARTVYVRVHKYMSLRYMRMRLLGFAHWTMDTGWQPTNRLSCMIDRLPVSPRCAAFQITQTIERSQNPGKYQGNLSYFVSQRQVWNIWGQLSINFHYIYDFSCRQLSFRHFPTEARVFPKWSNKSVDESMTSRSRLHDISQCVFLFKESYTQTMLFWWDVCGLMGFFTASSGQVGGGQSLTPRT